MPVESSSRLHRTPPPEDLPPSRTITPEPEEAEDTIAHPQNSPQGFGESVIARISNKARTQWLLSDEMKGVLREECIPFHVRGLPSSSPHASMNGLTAKTVPEASQKTRPELNEVVVSVVQKNKPKQISICPSYLVPWAPSKGNKVVIVGDGCIGQVGKLVELTDRFCIVELEPSKKFSRFEVEDVVNVLKK
jgi:hypothetical protein